MGDDRYLRQVSIRRSLLKPSVDIRDLGVLHFEMEVAEDTVRDHIGAISAAGELLAAACFDTTRLEEMNQLKFTAATFGTAIDFLFICGSGRLATFRRRWGL